MASNDKSVEFLYGTKFGRALLRISLALQLPKLLGFFLRTPLSHFYIKKFIEKNGIDMSPWSGQKFCSFNDFFTRKKEIEFDSDPSHLISPADSLLSVFPIEENSTFYIKGADYSLTDFFGTDEFNKKFNGGLCLVFRLCAADYHRYCYIDGGHVGENHFIKGKLYSVQPLPLEKFRVFTKNRRSWTILETQNFGTVAQVEVGAFSVGGIKNNHSNYDFKKGEEKGYFDLHGSTIVLLFEKGKISLTEEIKNRTSGGTEFRVKCGQYIADKN
ncbi:MAG: phosphatidylserine decarboxylase [Treponema sp.]|nr:phosphatidylserine decarboxylase [Treponema sp.]